MSIEAQTEEGSRELEKQPPIVKANNQKNVEHIGEENRNNDSEMEDWVEHSRCA